MMNELSFRQILPIFSNSTDYPTTQFNFYFELGHKLLPKSRWDDLFDDGLQYFIAHYLTLFKRAMEREKLGADAGQVVGNETAKSIDGISVTMDVSSVLLLDAGHWNQTIWGIQFYQLASLVGAGGVQL